MKCRIRFLRRQLMQASSCTELALEVLEDHSVRGHAL